MTLLFLKRSLAWPRATGHDVHAYHLMRACAAEGASVHLATTHPPAAEAVRGLGLGSCTTLDAVAAGSPPALSRLQERFRRYYGVPQAELAAVARLAEDRRAEAVVAVGLDALPWLGAVQGATRVWYAADEWVWHHATQFRPLRPATYPELRLAAVKGVYERVFRRVVDRVWVVSESEARAMRWLAGMPVADILPNGVDGDFFQPLDVPEEPESAVFWGRLDFGPNVQALEWFFARVWPLLRARHPSATITIIGFAPGAVVEGMASLPGVRIERDVPDLRETACRRQVVVLPFVSGGGIKNKLLEAAAMARPVVCTARATGGLLGREQLPFALADEPAPFAEAVSRFWQDEARRAAAGRAGRDWVVAHHTWTATARTALAHLRGAGAAHRNGSHG